MTKLHFLYKLLFLCVLATAFMPLSYAAEVADPNQVYRQNTFGAHRETVEDIRVKALGEDIRHTRSWNSGKWYFNRRWETLRIELKDSTSTEESNITIYRGAAKYEYKSSGIYAHETDSSQTIIKTGDSYRWKNRQGDWIDYDENRRAVNYGNRKNVTVTFQYDAQNRLTGVNDHNSNQVFWYEYNLDGDLSLVKDYSGRKVEYKYTAGELAEVIDVLGNSSTYTYENGRMLTKTDAEGRVTTIGYTPNGMVSGINNAGVNVSVFTEYDKTKREFYRRETYSTGKVIQKWYNRNGDFIRKTINGEYVKQTVISGLTRTTTDRAGNRTVKTYDQWDNLLSTTYSDGSKKSTEYENVFSKPIKEVNENGVVSLKEYDDRGNLTKLTEASGLPVQRVTTYTYDAYGNQLSKSIAADAVSVEVITSATYDPYGNQLTTIDGEGYITKYTYDVLGNVLTRTDPLDNVWSNTFDASGNRISKTDPLGHVTTYEYDKVGNLVKETDALNRATQHEYDGRDNQISEINALNQKKTWKYNSEGQVVQTTDAANKSTYTSYNVDGLPIRYLDGNGNATRMEYLNGSVNGSGELGKMFLPTYQEIMVYDERGRMVQKSQYIDDENSLINIYTYDSVGNRLSTIDAGVRQISNIYDAHNRVVEVIDSLNGSTIYSYDNRDNLLSVTDANSGVTQYTYNKNNQMTKVIKPLGEEIRYFYDALGRQESIIDSNNHKRVFVYDAAGRNTSIENYSVANDTVPIKIVTFSYDNVNNLLGYSDNVTSAIYQYDDLDRLVDTEVNFGGFAKSISYSYDPSGNKSSFTDTGGVTNTYTYDAADQLLAVKIPDIGQVSMGDYLWTKPQLVSFPGGALKSYSYDPLMRIKSIELKDPAKNSMLKYSYIYDGLNNITQKQTEHGAYHYNYDELGRLVLADNPTLDDEAYGYDSVGNRLNDSSVAGTWGYSLNNQLLTIGASSTYNYNDNGSLTKVIDGAKTQEFIYNVNNRLTTVIENSVTIASYQYDPFGRRIYKQVGGQATYYLYGEEGLVAEMDQSGVVLKQYGWKPNSIWGTDPVYLKEGGNVYFYQNDHLGTPQKLINQSGSVVWSAIYKSFGRAVVQTQSVVNNLRLPGQYYDLETGKHYNYFRDYDPDLGRYIETDPIGLDGGVNLYSYVSNNPIKLIDNYGLADCPNEGCFGKCMNNVPFINLAYVGLLGPAANLKLPGEKNTLGGKNNKSPWTSLDRRMGKLGKMEGGATVKRGKVGRVKYVGRAGTAAVAIGAFSAGYIAGSAIQCAIKCN